MEGGGKVFTLKGKLYNDEEQFMTNVHYRLLEGSNLWGELIPIEDKPICDGSDYIIELQNSRKIKCCLQAYSRRPMSIPARRVYRFTGTYPIYIN